MTSRDWRDWTGVRVRETLLEAADRAYRSERVSGPEHDPLLYCGCSHHTTSHHGPDGLGACGEDGCDCTGWHQGRIECPACSALWPAGANLCPRCGLTAVRIAAALAERSRR